MSRITFTTKTASANVRGPERASAGAFCGALVVGLIGNGLDSTRYAAMFPAGHYLREMARDRDYPAGLKFSSSLATALRVGDDTLTLPDGRTTTAFELSLNTAILLGNDVVRFMARLHGQCEVHGWVAEQNRNWLADIIEEGRRVELLREDMGWEAVVDLLRGSEPGPVVTSYSVTDSFPNPHLCGFTYDEARENDTWAEMEEIGRDEAWSRSMAAIGGGGLEWKPEDWATIRFGESVSVLDIMAAKFPEEHAS